MNAVQANEIIRRDQAAEADFQELLAVLREAFRLRRPDAYQRCVTLRDRELAMAQLLREQAEIFRGKYRLRAESHERRFALLSDVLTEGSKALAVPDFEGPTPETAAKPARIDPITRLVEEGHLDHGHERAARDIADLYESACRSVMMKSKDTRSIALGRTQGGTWRDSLSVALAWKRNRWYLPWVERMNRTPGLDVELVFAIAVNGESVRVVARRHRMADDKAVNLLRRGLDLFVDIVQAWPYDEDEAERLG